jgi:hypothetical protein
MYPHKETLNLIDEGHIMADEEIVGKTEETIIETGIIKNQLIIENLQT